MTKGVPFKLDAMKRYQDFSIEWLRSLPFR